MCVVIKSKYFLDSPGSLTAFNNPAGYSSQLEKEKMALEINA